MASVNSCHIIGNLGHPPSFREGNTPVCNLSVAVSSKVGGKEHTEWFNVVAFNKLAEICRDYLEKGSKVYIEGRIQTDEWTDKEGVKRKTTKLVANQMQMLSAKGGGEPSAKMSSREYSHDNPTYSKRVVGDDQIPF